MSLMAIRSAPIVLSEDVDNKRVYSRVALPAPGRMPPMP
jgi:hypothetical protein